MRMMDIKFKLKIMQLRELLCGPSEVCAKCVQSTCKVRATSKAKKVGAILVIAKLSPSSS
jgi:hypothetical protein